MVKQPGGGDQLARERAKDPALRQYMEDLNSIPRLDGPSNAAIVAAGGPDMRRQLVVGNLRLVITVATRYAGYGAPLLDLIGAGNLGLIEGIRRYDPAKKAGVSTYAYWWIREAVQAALYEHDVVSLPRYLRTLQYQLRREDSGLPVTIRATPAARARARRTSNAVESLDRRVGDDEHPNAQAIGDLIPDPGPSVEDLTVAAVDGSALDAITAHVDGLPPRQRQVIMLRYGIGQPYGATLTPAEISAAMGTPLHMVERLEARALEALRMAYAVRRPSVEHAS